MTIANKLLLFALLCIALLATGQQIPRGRRAQAAHMRNHTATASLTHAQKLTDAKRRASNHRLKRPSNGVIRRIKASGNDATAPSIGFLSAVALPIGGVPFGDVIVGDFNGDGKLDAAVLAESYNEETGYSYSIATVLGNGDGTFQPTVLTGLASEPYFIVGADLNKDGKTELITIDEQNCTVWLYQANGSFSGQSYAWGSSYYVEGITVADINGDGNLDVVIGDDEGDELSHVVTMLGDGKGGLTFASDVALDDWNDYAAFADVNGDGKLDVLGIDDNTGELQVFLATTTGYATHVDVPLASGGSYWGQIVVGDVNGDGKPDVVVFGSHGDELAGSENGYNYGCIAVYLNQGNGAFLPGLTEWSGFSTRGIAFADINGDGNTEIIASNEDGGDVTVMLADSDGWFTAPPLGYAVGGYAGGRPVVADFNHDGKLEVMTHDWEMNLIYLPNQGDGTLMAANNYYSKRSESTNYWYGYGISVATGDFNGDGHPDVVLGKSGSSADMGLTVFLGNGNGTFQPGVTYGDSEYEYYVAVTDFNGDGKLDIVATDNEAGMLLVHPGKGDGSFYPPIAFATDPSGSGGPDGLVVADFNNDGKPDVAVFNEENDNIGVLLNNGDGTAVNLTTYPLTGTGTLLAAGDLKGKGNMDIVAAEYWNDAVAVLLNNGDGTFQAPVETKLNLGFTARPFGIAIGDLNGDGKPDIALTLDGDTGSENNYMQYVAVMTGNGDGTFNAPVLYPATAKNTLIDTPWPGEIRIADLNNDGKPDLVYTNAEYGSVAVLYYKGNDPSNNPLYYDPVEFVSGGYAYGLSIVDLNSDGALDYVAAGDDFPGITIGYNTGGNALTVASSKSPALTTDTITVSAQVQPTARGVTSTPTGAITVKEGTATIGTITLSKGTGALSLSNLSAGTHSYIASYSGDSHFVPTTQGLVQVVKVPVPDFNFGANATSTTVQAGSSATFTLTVTPVNGFNSAVSLACGSGLGKGMSCSFSPAAVTPNGSAVGSTLTITTTAPYLTSMRPMNRQQQNQALWASLGSMGAFGIVILGVSARRRTRWMMVTLMAVFLLAAIVGCGSSHKTVTTTPTLNPNGTLAGQYTVNVTAAATGYNAKPLTLTISVQ